MTVRNRALIRGKAKLKIKRKGIECEGHREVAEQKCGNESQLIARNLEASQSCCRGGRGTCSRIEAVYSQCF